MKFFLVTLKKMKNRYLGNTTFIVHLKFVSLTFLKNKKSIKSPFEVEFYAISKSLIMQN